MELAGPESRTRLRKEGAPLKLISTGWPSKGAEPFLGARSHLLGEYHGNNQRGPQLSGLSFSSARSKVAGQVFLLCGVSYSLSCPFFCLCFSLPAWHGPCSPGRLWEDCRGKVWENVARQHRGMWQWGQANMVRHKKGNIWLVKMDCQSNVCVIWEHCCIKLLRTTDLCFSFLLKKSL